MCTRGQGVAGERARGEGAPAGVRSAVSADGGRRTFQRRTVNAASPLNHSSWVAWASAKPIEPLEVLKRSSLGTINCGEGGEQRASAHAGPLRQAEGHSRMASPTQAHAHTVRETIRQACTPHATMPGPWPAASRGPTLGPQGAAPSSPAPTPSHRAPAGAAACAHRSHASQPRAGRTSSPQLRGNEYWCLAVDMTFLLKLPRAKGIERYRFHLRAGGRKGNVGAACMSWRRPWPTCETPRPRPRAPRAQPLGGAHIRVQ